jgi:hypothetical protein
MFRRKSWWRYAVAAGAVFVPTMAGTGSSVASGAVRSSGTANGVWPGVGKVCGPGAGGASSVRGVSNKNIDIAVFTDADNSAQPGLDVEFPSSPRSSPIGATLQAESMGATSLSTPRTPHCSTQDRS